MLRQHQKADVKQFVRLPSRINPYYSSSGLRRQTARRGLLMFSGCLLALTIEVCLFVLSNLSLSHHPVVQNFETGYTFLSFSSKLNSYYNPCGYIL